MTVGLLYLIYSVCIIGEAFFIWYTQARGKYLDKILRAVCFAPRSWRNEAGGGRYSGGYVCVLNPSLTRLSIHRSIHWSFDRRTDPSVRRSIVQSSVARLVRRLSRDDNGIITESPRHVYAPQVDIIYLRVVALNKWTEERINNKNKRMQIQTRTGTDKILIKQKSTDSIISMLFMFRSKNVYYYVLRNIFFYSKEGPIVEPTIP